MKYEKIFESFWNWTYPIKKNSYENRNVTLYNVHFHRSDVKNWARRKFVIERNSDTIFEIEKTTRRLFNIFSNRIFFWLAKIRTIDRNYAIISRETSQIYSAIQFYNRIFDYDENCTFTCILYCLCVYYSFLTVHLHVTLIERNFFLLPKIRNYSHTFLWRL